MLLLHWIRIYGYDNIGFASSQSLVARYHLDTIMVWFSADERWNEMLQQQRYAIPEAWKRVWMRVRGLAS